MNVRWLVLCFSICASTIATAQEPARLLPFQGHLTKPKEGAVNKYEPVATGSYTILVSLYSSPEGGQGLVWGPERQENIPVVNGLVNLLIGSNKAFPADPKFFAQTLFVGVTVDKDNDPLTPDLEMVPRQQLLPALFAHGAKHALRADIATNSENSQLAASATNAINSDKLGGQTLNQIKELVNTAAGSAVPISGGSIAGSLDVKKGITSTRLDLGNQAALSLFEKTNVEEVERYLVIRGAEGNYAIGGGEFEKRIGIRIQGVTVFENNVRAPDLSARNINCSVVVGARVAASEYVQTRRLETPTISTTLARGVPLVIKHYVQIDGACKASSFTETSSRELKRDVKPLSTHEAAKTLRELNPVSFEYISDEKGDRQFGFIAEEVPAACSTSDRKSVQLMEMIAVLTKVVQQQAESVDELNGRVKKLELLLQANKPRIK
ncbi:tail fiber domain-containing protein [Aporhodopirellula aestuarii]|uniref:Tail fiber domain-containing protein n=1 Tax=Aporhodopirellula aestuarii TaxID=2950107 RepID=A0ABT0UEB4_9BACT|nr:tail fiber domain-containing protein [Aporhodopirellula aestuarii]MCM2374708.1 tail fiber domain-containing protein [Aporhodopirellula aestuarii]